MDRGSLNTLTFQGSPWGVLLLIYVSGRNLPWMYYTVHNRLKLYARVMTTDKQVYTETPHKLNIITIPISHWAFLLTEIHFLSTYTCVSIHGYNTQPFVYFTLTYISSLETKEWSSMKATSLCNARQTSSPSCASTLYLEKGT